MATGQELASWDQAKVVGREERREYYRLATDVKRYER